MKKFYKLVSTRPDQGGWLIELDSKPVRTPAGTMLRAPAEPLATLIAQEWMAQVTDILPDTMPLTQLLVTMIDRIERERPVIQDTVLGYLDTDLLCYRISEPEDLARKEEAARDPWRRWFEKKYNCALCVTTGLAALRQEEKAHAQARTAVLNLDMARFTVLQMITAITGSLVLALAFVVGAADEDDVARALYVEEDHKSEIYNEDFYGRAPHQEKSMQGVARDLKAGRVFLEALGLKN